MTSHPSVETASPDTAYASFTVRFRALFIDILVVAIAVTILMVLVFILPDFPGSGRILVVAVVLIVFLYEPVMVWRYGATIGHRRTNLLVVADQTGQNPSFPRALLRFLIKNVMGLPSFVTMALTERHQAVHDRVTGTTVQIRDLTTANPGDVQWARAPLSEVGLPSRLRRGGVILGYVFLATMMLGVSSNATQSDACTARANGCSSRERVWGEILAVAWMATVTWCAVRGWQGRLFGARRTPPTDDVAAVAAAAAE